MQQSIKWCHYIATVIYVIPMILQYCMLFFSDQNKCTFFFNHFTVTLSVASLKLNSFTLIKNGWTPPCVIKVHISSLFSIWIGTFDWFEDINKVIVCYGEKLHDFGLVCHWAILWLNKLQMSVLAACVTLYSVFYFKL